LRRQGFSVDTSIGLCLRAFDRALTRHDTYRRAATRARRAEAKELESMPAAGAFDKRRRRLLKLAAK
jgi:hypothetical protein